ncbi:dihydroorotase [Polaribacter aestuariivivens]|uniref:dihydroorotase n=1 Tax=Polaribacter aestuariivivens TaxID=2304626 RepID=UPI003F493A22
MKNLIFTFLFVCSVSMFGQNSSQTFNKGDVFTVQQVENNNYEHIHFPKANFIIKKGGIVNYSNIVGEKVEISSTKKNSKGELIATIKLASGKRFFNSHKYVSVNIEDALENKELERS